MGSKIQLTYRQPIFLKTIVTGLPSEGKGQLEADPGCFKCSKNCHACKILVEGKHFQSKKTGRKYPIRQKVSCDSSQYVGKSTQQFRRRHSGHKQEIKNVIRGLGHHYGGPRGCGYISIQIIEKVNQDKMFCPKWGRGTLL